MPRKTIASKKSYAQTFVLTLWLGVVLFSALFVVACAPVKATRGNYVEDERLQSLQVLVSSKGEVERKLGSPTTVDPFDNNKWFYIGEKTETTSFFDPDVISRKVLALTFNEDGLLQTADYITEADAKKVEIVTKTTPAPGREMNAFEQFISNIGKFNQSGMSQNVPGR